MRRKFIAAVTSGVLALTVIAALPTHAEAVSIWLDLTPGTESVETFQYKDYADRYSDATSSMAMTLRRCSTTMRRSARPRTG